MSSGFDPTVLGMASLGSEIPRDEFPVEEDSLFEITSFEDENYGADALDRLMRKGGKNHNKLLEAIKTQLNASQHEMSRFYDRWESNELRMQAHIDLRGKDALLRDQNNQGKQPSNIPIVIPYGYAAISTIVTYLTNVFASRKPIFTLGSYRGEDVYRAKNMENLLQFQADYMHLVGELWTQFNDVGTYGVGALKCSWDIIEEMRTTRSGDQLGLGQTLTTRAPKVVYEGNNVDALDPFYFFPDPRVAMAKVATEGEFVYWRTFESRMALTRNGDYQHVDKIKATPPRDKFGTSSRRNHLARGKNLGELDTSNVLALDRDFVQVDQGTSWIIPKDFGLTDKTEPELWLFTVGNLSQIIEAVPFDMDHSTHPVAVAEPFGNGHGFGHACPADYMAPIQDEISWLLNSHKANVRTAINNQFVVDTSRVVWNDVINPGAGRLIRLKKTAMGSDVRTAIHQLPVQDFTRGHLADIDLMISLGDMILAVNENLRGQPGGGGRKTATETRISGQAAVSRMALTGRIISTQSMTKLGRMMSLNTQQWISPEFEFRVGGQDAANATIRPIDVDGEFYFPIQDGTLPLDKLGILQTWEKIFLAAVQSPEINASHDVGRIFEYIAELGGATNIEDFRRQPAQDRSVALAPDEDLERERERGNVVPISQAQGLR